MAEGFTFEQAQQGSQASGAFTFEEAAKGGGSGGFTFEEVASRPAPAPERSPFSEREQQQMAAFTAALEGRPAPDTPASLETVPLRDPQSLAERNLQTFESERDNALARISAMMTPEQRRAQAAEALQTTARSQQFLEDTAMEGQQVPSMSERLDEQRAARGLVPAEQDVQQRTARQEAEQIAQGRGFVGRQAQAATQAAGQSLAAIEQLATGRPMLQAGQAITGAVAEEDPLATPVTQLAGAMADPVFLATFAPLRAGAGAVVSRAAQTGAGGSRLMRGLGAVGRAAEQQGTRGFLAREGIDAAAGIPADLLTGAIAGGAQDGVEGAVKQGALEAGFGAVAGPIVGGLAREVPSALRQAARARDVAARTAERQPRRAAAQAQGDLPLTFETNNIRHDFPVERRAPAPDAIPLEGEPAPIPTDRSGMSAFERTQALRGGRREPEGTPIELTQTRPVDRFRQRQAKAEPPRTTAAPTPAEVARAAVKPDAPRPDAEVEGMPAFNSREAAQRYANALNASRIEGDPQAEVQGSGGVIPFVVTNAETDVGRLGPPAVTGPATDLPITGVPRAQPGIERFQQRQQRAQQASQGGAPVPSALQQAPAPRNATQLREPATQPPRPEQAEPPSILTTDPQAGAEFTQGARAEFLNRPEIRDEVEALTDSGMSRSEAEALVLEDAPTVEPNAGPLAETSTVRITPESPRLPSQSGDIPATAGGPKPRKPLPRFSDPSPQTRSEPPAPRTPNAAGEEAGPMFSGVPVTPQAMDRAIKNAAEDAIDQTGRITRLSQRVFRRGRNFIAQFDEQLGKEMDTVDIAAGQRAAVNREDLRGLFKGVPRQARETAMKVMNGRAQSSDPRILKLVEDARAVLDRDLSEAQQLGVQRRLDDGTLIPVGGSGKAYPQVPNKEGRRFLRELARKGSSSPRVLRWAEQMVAEGNASDVGDAIAQMRGFQSRLRGTNRYFEQTRVELPEELVEWDPAKTLPDTVERNAAFIEGVRQWGFDPGGRMPQAQARIEAIRAEQGSEVADPIQTFFEYEFGAKSVNPDDAAIARSISSFQTMSKLGFSVLSAMRNLGQPFAGMSRFGIIPVLKANAAQPPILARFLKGAQQIHDELARSGSVRGRTTLTELETPEGGLTDKALTLFTAAERRNQHTTALAARYAIESDLKRLSSIGKGDRFMNLLRAVGTLGDQSEGAIQRRLSQRAGLDEGRIKDLTDKVASGERLETADVADAMFLINRDTNFPLTLTTRRLWWTQSPWARLAAKFKTFSVEQTGLIYRDVIQESVKGNLAPLARFVTATLVVGEIYNTARDALVGDDQALSTGLRRGTLTDGQDAALRILNNIVDGGGAGIVADMVYGVSDWSLGPVWGTLESALDTGAHIAAKPTPDQTANALFDFAKNEFVVAGQIEGAKNRIEQAMGKQNRALDYRQARNLLSSLGERADDPGLRPAVQRAVTQSLLGRPSFQITGRTLSLRHAAEQIAVGDVEDAGGYFATIIQDAAPEERGRVIQGIRQSMRSRAPFGRVAARDLPSVLQGLPAERRREFIQLQQQWLRDANRALGIGLRQYRQQESRS